MEYSSQKSIGPSNPRSTLVIMAKAPKLGVVKTRLAHYLPPPVVTELYRCLLEDTIALAQSLVSVDVAIMCPALDVEELTRLTGGMVGIVTQKGVGLAAALTSVFAHFGVNGQRIIAFNSDSPHLPPSVLTGAFEALTTCDVVVGPTHDGGYYLVGAKAPHSGIFNGDGMGTSNALETLLERVRALGLSVRLAEPFYDIDVISDLIRLDAELERSPQRAPRTAAWLAQWRPVVEQCRLGSGEL